MAGNQRTEPYYGDLEKTQILQSLCDVAEAQRDDTWRQKFTGNAADASFVCGNPQVIQGPDGFPYFELNIPEPGPFTCFVIRHLKDDYLLENGLGVVIHPKKANPDWVFTYGDIVNLHLNGVFYSPVPVNPFPKKEKIEKEESVLAAQPSEQYLPSFVRKNLHAYLTYLKIKDVKIVLMQRQSSAGSVQELVFNLTAAKFPSHEYYEQIMGNIRWFLPAHYSYVAMDDSVFQSSFAPLY